MATRKLMHLLLLPIAAVLSAQKIFAEEVSHRPADVVQTLYREFAWVAIGMSGTDISDQPRSELEKYFDAQLTDLIIKDAECRLSRNDICHLDRDMLYDSQDPVVLDLKISAPQRESEVNVNFRSCTGKVSVLKYMMVRTPQGWRIHDISYGPGRATLRALLGNGM